MWEFSQLVTERKIAITAQREQLNFLVHRAAALIPGKTGWLPFVTHASTGAD